MRSAVSREFRFRRVQAQILLRDDSVRHPAQTGRPTLGRIRPSIQEAGWVGTTRRSNPGRKVADLQEGMKSGFVSDTCRRHGIAQRIYNRWKDEAGRGVKARIGRKSTATVETEILKNVVR